MERRDFLAGMAGAAGLAKWTPGTPAVPGARPGLDITMDEVTIAELQSGMAAGRFGARDLVEHYLQRIAQVDRAGPALRSVLETNPEALAIAATLDDERRAGRVRGPLHGIPVLIKDNIDTGDRMKTSAGSLALADTSAPRDAGVAARLRAAGAVILGKTNLSEWANFRSTRSSSGWSGRGGQTRNPYVLDRNPCGSSSGTGAAISANLAVVGIGTETDGSIVCPSHQCGLVGLKPTVGLLPGDGIVPISHSQDTAGPMARTVTDAAALLSALALGGGDYSRLLEPGALDGARIGVLRQDFGFDARVDAIMEESLAALRHAGAELVDPVRIPSAKKVGEPEFEVLLYEFKSDLAAYLATRTDQPHRTLADLIAFNTANADRELQWFGQELFEMAEKKGPLTEPAYRKALAASRRYARTEGLDAAFAKHRLDAIVAPTGGPAWVTDLLTGDHFGGGNSALSAVSGYPAITVPAGSVRQLPVGLTLMGKSRDEARLLAFAYAFEQATKVRRAPTFVPTLA
ncbi:MAG TPA: amidase [Gemmatimonadales bacterium]|nr:amidase [Gemmatimonadales bacterium]